MFDIKKLRGKRNEQVKTKNKDILQKSKAHRRRSGRTGLGDRTCQSYRFCTIKTAISIFLCLVVYMLIEQFGFTDTSNAFLACVTAIICMKDSVDESLHTGLFRLVGTFIGAVSGMAYIYLARMLDEAM